MRIFASRGNRVLQHGFAYRHRTGQGVQNTDLDGVLGGATRFAVGDKLRLIPGHCDPTVNLYDCYVCMRNGRVETLWPITARGRTW